MMWAIFIIAAYLIGSIPCGVLIARTQGVDITAHGSGNIGATNVGRVLGRQFGFACFALDLLKGALPVVLTGLWFHLLGDWPNTIPALDMWGWLCVALATIAGHMASIFLKFRGGKGVATAFGAMLAIWPALGLPAVISFLIWLVALSLTRIISVASMTAALSLPVLTTILLFTQMEGPLGPSSAPPIVMTCLIASLVLWRHRGNIMRLRSGTETRVGSSHQ